MMNVNKNDLRKSVAENMGGFFAMQKGLQRSTHFVSKVTGELVELTQGDKLVFAYVVDKLNFYLELTRLNGTEHKMMESMAYIANELCLSDRTVSRAVHKLAEHGFIQASLVSRQLGWVYTGIDSVQTFHKEVSANSLKRMPVKLATKHDQDVSKPVAVVQDEPKAVVTMPVRVQEAIADPTPDDGMPDYLYAPEFDYSDIESQMTNTDYEPRVGVMADDFDYGMMTGHTQEQAA